MAEFRGSFARVCFGVSKHFLIISGEDEAWHGERKLPFEFLESRVPGSELSMLAVLWPPPKCSLAIPSSPKQMRLRLLAKFSKEKKLHQL